MPSLKTSLLSIFVLSVVLSIHSFQVYDAAAARPDSTQPDSSKLGTGGTDSVANASTGGNVPPISDGTGIGDSDSSGTDPAYNLPAHTLDRVISKSPFRVGEKLTFTIRYGIIKAGEATMEVKKIVNVYDSIPAYHIITTARSAKFFDAFYKVRDSVETFLDTRGFFSWKYNKHLREGGYKFDLLVEYDQIHGIASVEKIRYHSHEPLEVRNREKFQLEVPEYVMDVLGAFYYARTQELRVGEPIYMVNHDNEKTYDLQVIIQKKERVKVKAGTFDCIMVQPRLLGDAIFQQKGELWVWLTDDEYKIPVQMKSKVAVGSITSELKNIEGVALPIKAQVK